MRENGPSAGLYDLLEEVGASSGLEQTLAALDRNLRRLLPFDAMAVYLMRDERFRPVYRTGTAAGESFKSTMSVPLDNGTDLVGMLALYSAESGAFRPSDLGALLWMREDLSRILVGKSCGAAAPVGLHVSEFLLQQLDEELRRRRARNEGLTILVCAVDGLAAVRERWGEEAEERLAVALARGLERTRQAFSLDGGHASPQAFGVRKLTGGDLEAARISMASFVEATGRALFGSPQLTLRMGAAQFPEEGLTGRALLTLADSRVKKAPSAPEGFSEDLIRLAGSLEAAGQPVEISAPEPEYARIRR